VEKRVVVEVTRRVGTTVEEVSKRVRGIWAGAGIS
jgi:hypothetical protein